MEKCWGGGTRRHDRAGQRTQSPESDDPQHPGCEYGASPGRAVRVIPVYHTSPSLPLRYNAGTRQKVTPLPRARDLSSTRERPLP
jgi:hypothetical protein